MRDVTFGECPIATCQRIWLLPELEYLAVTNNRGMTAERRPQQSRTGPLRAGNNKLSGFGHDCERRQVSSTRASGNAKMLG